MGVKPQGVGQMLTTRQEGRGRNHQDHSHFHCETWIWEVGMDTIICKSKLPPHKTKCNRKIFFVFVFV